MDIKKINGFAVVSALDEGLLGRYNSALYFKQFKDELLNKIKGNGVGKENFKGSLKLIRSELLKASIQEKLLFYFDVDAVFNSLLLDNLKNIENMKFDVESAGIVKKLLETLFYNVFENNKLFLDFLSEELASLKIKKGAADILSTLRAAKELGESMIVNPNNVEEVAQSIHSALNMPVNDQIERNTVLQKRLKIYNEERWAKDFIGALEEVKQLQESNYTKKITDSFLQKLTAAYQQTKSRIIFLDYDGTLTGFHKDPQMAIPNDELYEIIDRLTEDSHNIVVIISGRHKETLSKWFDKHDNLAFIAEHGVWVRNPNEEWMMNDQIDQDWMEIVAPVLNNYVDRTPRSFIEQKNR